MSGGSKIEKHPVIDEATAIKKLAVKFSPWRPKNVVKKPVVKNKKSKKK